LVRAHFDLLLRYALSLGTFPDESSNGGGRLCVEVSATEVAEVDTHGKMARQSLFHRSRFALSSLLSPRLSSLFPHSIIVARFYHRRFPPFA
jgi:hypothetical protein